MKGRGGCLFSRLYSCYINLRRRGRCEYYFNVLQPKQLAKKKQLGHHFSRKKVVTQIHEIKKGLTLLKTKIYPIQKRRNIPSFVISYQGVLLKNNDSQFANFSGVIGVKEGSKFKSNFWRGASHRKKNKNGAKLNPAPKLLLR